MICDPISGELIDKADDMKIKMDEEKTGKVITQKNKLRNLIK